MPPDPWAQAAFSGKFTKLRIPKAPVLLPLVCGTSEWKVNVSQFNANSKYFKRLFGTSALGRNQDVYPLAEADENAAAAVVKYLTTGDYAARPTKDRGILMPVYHLRVLAASITYKVNGLGKLASDNFKTCFWPGFWETEDFAATAEHVFADAFSLGHVRLRDHYRTLVIETMKDHTMEIMALHANYARLHVLMRTAPELAYQLLRGVALLPPRATMAGTQSLGPELPTSPASQRISSASVAIMTATANAPRAEISDTDEGETERSLLKAPTTRHNAGSLQGSTFAPRQNQSRKRKRGPSPSFADSFKRFSRKCAICEANFQTSFPFSRDDIHSRQCRTCADQLERRINFDEHDEFGRRLF